VNAQVHTNQLPGSFASGVAQPLLTTLHLLCAPCGLAPRDCSVVSGARDWTDEEIVCDMSSPSRLHTYISNACYSFDFPKGSRQPRMAMPSRIMHHEIPSPVRGTHVGEDDRFAQDVFEHHVQELLHPRDHGQRDVGQPLDRLELQIIPAQLVERFRQGNARVSFSSSRVLPPHRPREGGLAHPADTSISNLADAWVCLRGHPGFPNNPSSS
jgi:hypothetical protein